MDLSLSVRDLDGVAVLVVEGEVDVYSAPQLRDSLIQLVADGRTDIVVDLERVEFLDSTGLGVLVGGLKRARAVGGQLRLACSQDRILKIFRITGLTKVFDIYPTAADAAIS